MTSVKVGRDEADRPQVFRTLAVNSCKRLDTEGPDERELIPTDLDCATYSAELVDLGNLAFMKNQFKTLRASSLYCQRCKVARPVRERLLLVLPDREIYDYLCTECGSSVGSREVKAAETNRPSLII